MGTPSVVWLQLSPEVRLESSTHGSHQNPKSFGAFWISYFHHGGLHEAWMGMLKVYFICVSSKHVCWKTCLRCQFPFLFRSHWCPHACHAGGPVHPSGAIYLRVVPLLLDQSMYSSTSFLWFSTSKLFSAVTINISLPDEGQCLEENRNICLSLSS